LGLRAARLYGAEAAGAPHALHMTSHIFIALGMWDEVISANVDAMRAENAGQSARGLPLFACFHYEEWLVYGYLQKGDLQHADARMAACREKVDLKLKTHPQPAFPDGAHVISYSDMLVRRAVETGQWPANLLPVLDDGAYVEARFNLAYGEALTATSQPARMHSAAARLRGLLVQLEGRKATPGSEAQAAQSLAFYRVMGEEIAALERVADGNMQEGLAALQRAAEHEIAAPLDFGPPTTPKPTLELLGDLLLASGRPADAEDAYRRALARTPGRRLASIGLTRAQLAASHSTAEAPLQPSPTANLPTPADHHH
jgi:predicted Zn-dependent protease